MRVGDSSYLFVGFARGCGSEALLFGILFGMLFSVLAGLIRTYAVLLGLVILFVGHG